MKDKPSSSVLHVTLERVMSLSRQKNDASFADTAFYFISSCKCPCRRSPPPPSSPSTSNTTVPSQQTPTSTSTPTPSTSLKRRSARVQKRDPIVAPGFGTHKDLISLSDSLGLPLQAVQAIMESRGRGIRGASKKDEAEPPTPISHAWADFMMEEGMTTTTTTTAQDKESQDETTTATASSKKTTTSDSPREYQLPLVPSWSSADDEPRAKKLKTTGCVLVQTGTLDSRMIGRTKRALDRPYDLTVPTILMSSLKVTKLIASCNSAHAICIDTAGNAYGWGRNEANQLTQHLPEVVPLPTKLDDICQWMVLWESRIPCFWITGKAACGGVQQVGTVWH